MGEGGEIKLLSHWSSPFVVRAKLALELKRIKYEIIEEQDLHNAKSQLLLESNPVNKKVPVLLHNGKAICESMNIVEYLDEVWAENGTRPGFLPKNPYDRAMARFWVSFIDTKLMESATVAMWGKCEEDRVKGNANFVETCVTLEEVLRKKDGVGPFFGGQSMNFVDIALSFLANNLPVVMECSGLLFPDGEQCPLLHTWMQAVNDSPSAKAAFPDRKRLKEVFNAATAERRKN